MTLARESLDTKSAKEKLAKTELPTPGYFSAKGLLHDPDWVDSYLSIVLQWPKSCTIAVEDRQLIGLAKSLGFMWEPGILNHTDLALETGIKPEQITEAVKVVSSVIGLANLDNAAKSTGTANRLDEKRRRLLACVKEYFGVIPSVFRRTIVLEDLKWLNDLLLVTGPAYDSGHKIIHPRLRAYVALAAASVIGWEDGISLYAKVAQRFGGKKSEVHDIIKSVFKTTVSNSMAAGFRSPCHIPRLDKYTTILSSYVEKGALSKRKTDALSSASH
jgi:alkylhydroperoxidase/carboxymuconolactone decarboxylase family protein YurZ